MDFLNLQKDVDFVKNDLLARFPNCSHTVRIILWDDETCIIECTHGSESLIHTSTLYDGKLTYKETPLREVIGGLLIDEYGREYKSKDPF